MSFDSRAIGYIMSTLFYPIITFFLLAICIAYWAMTAVYPSDFKHVHVQKPVLCVCLCYCEVAMIDSEFIHIFTIVLVEQQKTDRGHGIIESFKSKLKKNEPSRCRDSTP